MYVYIYIYKKYYIGSRRKELFLILDFRRVLNVVNFL